ncbi:MAG TPA: hypothetical protein VKF63_00675 [Terracidiphilus sp.]|nr:hypothetical protein [Terracidiphilus sp.]
MPARRSQPRSIITTTRITITTITITLRSAPGPQAAPLPGPVCAMRFHSFKQM